MNFGPIFQLCISPRCISGPSFRFRIAQSTSVEDWMVFRKSGSCRNSRLMIYSQLVLGSTVVVTVKGIRFYSGTERAVRDVRTRPPLRLTSFDHVWVIAVVLFPWRRVSYFVALKEMLPEKDEAGASRNAAERKRTKPSHHRAASRARR